MNDRRRTPRDFPSIRRATWWEGLIWTVLGTALAGGVLWVVLGWLWQVEWRMC